MRIHPSTATRKPLHPAAWLACAAMLLAGGCSDESSDANTAPQGKQTTASDVQDAYGQAAEATWDWLDARQEAFVQQVQQTYENSEPYIQDLRDAARQAQGTGRETLMEASDKMYQAREKLHDELQQARNAGEEGWEASRQGLQDAMKKLETLTEQARQKLEGSDSAAENLPETPTTNPAG
jgi:chromosome segregation ATPase